MADFVDAANGLADAVMVALGVAPNGTVPLIGGAAIKVYIGWPDKQTLDTDLAAGTVHVSVWPLPMEKVTSITQADADWIDENATTASRETRRQTKQFQITIWANAPDTRDTLGRALDAALSDTFRLTLPDGSQAVLAYRGGRLTDDRQTANLYRRDSTAEVNFATLLTMAATPISQIDTTLSVQVNDATVATIPIITTS